MSVEIVHYQHDPVSVRVVLVDHWSAAPVIMEQIFALPGMGRLMLDSLQRRDYTMVSGVNLVIATVVVGANLLVDISYAYLDPRVRYK